LIEQDVIKERGKKEDDPDVVEQAVGQSGQISILFFGQSNSMVVEPNAATK
jgi:hypothetical protein